jgi:multiple sugar transport system permease protein
MAQVTALPAQRVRPARFRLTNAQRETLAALGFLAPNLLGFLLLMLGPTVFSFGMGFMKWGGLDLPKWIGLENYTRLLHDPIFLKAVHNTALYTLEFVPLVMIFATGLAVLFNRKTRGTAFVRVLCFIPIITDMISVSFAWTWIYHLRFGVLNYFLSFFGIPPQAWLGDIKWALFALVVLSVWRWMGYYAVIILAGLQGVPESLYEAAKIDGVTQWQSFAHITLPLISPTLFFVMTTAIMSSFQVFEQMWVMTKGGPLDSTISIAMFLYQQGFQFLKMGYASAVAWALFFIIFGVTVINWFVRKRWVYEG